MNVMKPEIRCPNPIDFLLSSTMRPHRRFWLAPALAGLLSVAGPASAANFVKADNSTALNVSGSWTTPGVPGNADTALWDNTFSPANNSTELGGRMTWAGIVVGNNLQSAFTINATGTNALTVGTGGINLVVANQNFIINSPLIQGSNETWIVNSGQSLTLNGPVFGGTATANNTFGLTTLGSGTINFNGNYSEAGNVTQGQNLLINSNTININPGPTGSFTSGKKVIIGNIAASSTTVNILSGTNFFTATNYVVMCDNATATAVLNISGGQTTIANSSQSFANALKGTGVVNVATATLIFGANTRVAIGSDQANGFTGADGTLNINNGGTVVATAGAQYFSLGNGGPSSFGRGRLNLNSGGTLICARNIIKNQANASGFITFNGGTLQAGLNSATFLQGLTTATVSTNGGTIDDGGFAVTIAQSLLHDATVTSDGGLIKQGSGSLTLSGTNTYNGGTTVSAGNLIIPKAAGGAPGNYTVAGGAGLVVRAGVPGGTLGAASLTLNAGSVLTLDATTLSAPLLTVTNALTSAATVTLNLTNMTVGPGQYPLIKYGALGGAGIGGFVLGSTPLTVGVILSLTNNAANQSIDLLAATAPSLTWNGTAGGAWDIGVTANWQGNQSYSESGGAGPIVNFDDTAAGTTAITLNTSVSPAGIIVNNSSLAYGISGAGQISGNGVLIKNGTGTLTLNTANTFTNVTSITAGTLQLGDGTANNGSVGGNINDGATLVVANPNPQTMNNLISGNGSLVKSGAGTLTLTSSNTLSGTMSVNNGTLALNPGGSGGIVPVLGSISNLNVAAGAALTLAGANTLGTNSNVGVTLIGGSTLTTVGSGSHFVGSLTLGDFTGGSTLTGPGAIIDSGNLTNFGNTTVSLGSLTVGSTNLILANSSTLTVVSNFNLLGPAATAGLITGDPNSGSGTLTTKGNVTITRGEELEFMTWKVDLGTNVMNVTSKLTFGKIPGLPVSVEWISGTGLVAPNDYFAIADANANNPGAIGELDVLGGSLTISNTSVRCLIGNGGAGTINISGGSLQFAGPTSVQLGGDVSFSQNGASGTLNISGSGSVTIGPASLGLSLAANNGTASGITGTLNLNGGSLTTWPKIANGSTNANGQSYINFNGGTLKAGTNNPVFLQGLTQATVQSGGAIIDDGGHVITIGQSLTDGGGGLTKLGSGTLILTNVGSYSGVTTVSNGTLEVDGNLSVSPVTVASGGALSGNGTLGSDVTINVGGTLAPGTNAPGVLTINGNLMLNGSLQIAVNKSLALSNSLVTVGGSLMNGGTGVVMVTNAGPSLVAGDSFQLFNAPVVNGGALTIAGGAGVVWTNKLAIDGSIQVLSAAPPINPLPGVVQFAVSGNTLNLFWPTNAGWILQTQTNALAVGLNTNWLTVPGSDSLTNLSVTINPANGAVFYRLVHP
jgi:fibronectin-binding autotransporter adhesin